MVNLAVIGTGRIGRMHAFNIATRIEEARLVAVADIVVDSARSCGSQLGLTKIYDDPRKVLDDAEVDAVLICTATNTHAELIEAAAEAGKHIFCEKPIALDLAPIDSALAKVAAAGVKLQVGFNRRFDPAFAAVRNADIGERHILRITSRDPSPPPIEYVRVSGGLFLDMMIHDFDMARFIVGREVESLYAVGAVRIDPAIGEAGDVDTAVVTLTFDDGLIATIDNSRRATYGYDQRIELFGEQGMVWADNPKATTTGRADGAGHHAPPLPEFFIERYTESYLAELRAFVRCVIDDTVPPVTGADGRAPVVLGLAAKRSLAEGRVVRLSEMA